MAHERTGTYTVAGSSGKGGRKGWGVRQASRCKASRVESGSDRGQALPIHFEDASGDRILSIGGERSIVEELRRKNVDLRLRMRMGNARPFISMTGF